MVKLVKLKMVKKKRKNADVFEGRYENGYLNGKGIFLNSKQKELELTSSLFLII